MESNQPAEIFRSVVGYDGRYEVSDCGSIKRVARLEDKRKSRLSEKMLRPAILKIGYPMVSITKDSKQKSYYVHRLVALAFLPNPEGLPMVNHKDSDKTNNHVSNLEWCTNSHNLKHAYENGKMDHRQPARGSGHGNAILSEAAVLKIKRMLTAGFAGVEIAKEFSVTKSTISGIKHGRGWAWLTPI